MTHAQVTRSLRRSSRDLRWVFGQHTRCPQIRHESSSTVAAGEHTSPQQRYWRKIYPTLCSCKHTTCTCKKGARHLIACAMSPPCRTTYLRSSLKLVNGTKVWSAPGGGAPDEAENAPDEGDTGVKSDVSRAQRHADPSCHVTTSMAGPAQDRVVQQAPLRVRTDCEDSKHRRLCVCCMRCWQH